MRGRFRSARHRAAPKPPPTSRAPATSLAPKFKFPSASLPPAAAAAQVTKAKQTDKEADKEYHSSQAKMIFLRSDLKARIGAPTLPFVALE